MKHRKAVMAATVIFILAIVAGVIIYKKSKTNNNEESGSTEVEYTTDNLEPVPIEQAEIGDVITMGRIEQDGDETTKDEPIYWDVLDKKDGKILVISHYVIFRAQFSQDKDNVIWEESDIRKELNGEFYDETFNEEEKSRIVESIIQNPSAKKYEIELGNFSVWGDSYLSEILGDMPETSDKLFLLSLEEAIQYYKPLITKNELSEVKSYESDNLLAKPTYVVMMEEYEYRQKITEEMVGHGDGIYRTEGMPWALRSQGSLKDFVYGIDHMGIIRGSHPTYISGIRPAMWIQTK